LINGIFSLITHLFSFVSSSSGLAHVVLVANPDHHAVRVTSASLTADARLDQTSDLQQPRFSPGLCLQAASPVRSRLVILSRAAMAAGQEWRISLTVAGGCRYP
jgi:hypothetical protein